MTTYRSISHFNPGTIQQIIKTSYAPLIDYFPGEKQRFYELWEQEDMDAFSHPDTVGKHVLFTCVDEQPVGFFSWDDRPFPIGIIGQNCVIPDYQGNGYGQMQIEWIIQLLAKQNFAKIIAITGDHVFFKPAHKMFKACGFESLGKRKGDLFDLIEFSKDLV